MSSKNDNIPTNDLDMSTWLGHFGDNLNAYLDDLGLTPADVAFIAARQAEFAAAVEQQMLTQREARAASAAKHSLRAEIERQLRPFIRQINEHPNMTNDVRASLGLNQRSGHRYHHAVGPEIPVLKVETHVGGVFVHFGDNPDNEWLNKRPKWARGCHIYRRKSGEAEYQLIACATTSPYIDQIPEEAVICTYVARYVGVGNADLGVESVAHSVAAGRGRVPEAA